MPIGRFDTCSAVRWRSFCVATQCTRLQRSYRTMEIVVRWRSIRCCDCSSCAVRWKSLTTQYTCLQRAIDRLRSDTFCCRCRLCRHFCCCICGLVRRDSKLRRCNADDDVDWIKRKFSRVVTVAVGFVGKIKKLVGWMWIIVCWHHKYEYYLEPIVPLRCGKYAQNQNNTIQYVPYMCKYCYRYEYLLLTILAICTYGTPASRRYFFC